ncbi:MAG: hypothetical protein HYR76_13555 [Ignavibacteria bacterium]|nr:hypothetical protein [Ignavibacteria bacterium]MBI3766012.1 hypothetical protein [Ignavibacteriales bacterium]
MEHKLKHLFALQQVDSQLQEVQDLKGDLPMIVTDLETKVTEMQARLKELNGSIKQSKIDRDNADMEIVDLAGKIEKFKSQQLNVKSNKQYDALTREIEAAEERTLKLEEQMESFEGKMEIAKKDIEALTVQLEESTAELNERRKELHELNKEHEKEELKLQHEREKLLARIDKSDLARYERIKKAKGGIAIVPIKRGACGGCFNRVPPQKILEIRQNANFFACEHCGRLLVSDHIVEMSLAI